METQIIATLLIYTCTPTFVNHISTSQFKVESHFQQDCGKMKCSWPSWKRYSIVSVGEALVLLLRLMMKSIACMGSYRNNCLLNTKCCHLFSMKNLHCKCFCLRYIPAVLGLAWRKGGGGCGDGQKVLDQ